MCTTSEASKWNFLTSHTVLSLHLWVESSPPLTKLREKAIVTQCLSLQPVPANPFPFSVLLLLGSRTLNWINRTPTPPTWSPIQRQRPTLLSTAVDLFPMRFLQVSDLPLIVLRINDFLGFQEDRGSTLTLATLSPSYFWHCFGYLKYALAIQLVKK